MKSFDIYEEGYVVMEWSARANHTGVGIGDSFLEACKNYIAKTGRGEIRKTQMEMSMPAILVVNGSQL